MMIHRPLGEVLDLPARVRRVLQDSDDPMAIIRTLLEADGPPVSVDRDVLVSKDRVLVVLDVRIGDPVTADMLNHAYRRFKQTGASVGVVVSPGIMPLAEVRRREMFDPALLHAGLDGLQRMADAVDVGADPLDFVAAPAVVARVPATRTSAAVAGA
jgi:hypothetical protein